jgi:hypothetical protein
MLLRTLNNICLILSVVHDEINETVAWCESYFVPRTNSNSLVVSFIACAQAQEKTVSLSLQSGESAHSSLDSAPSIAHASDCKSNSSLSPHDSLLSSGQNMSRMPRLLSRSTVSSNPDPLARFESIHPHFSNQVYFQCRPSPSRSLLHLFRLKPILKVSPVKNELLVWHHRPVFAQLPLVKMTREGAPWWRETDLALFPA